MQMNIMPLEIFKKLPKEDREKQLKIYKFQQEFDNQVNGEGYSDLYDQALKIHKELL